MPLGSRSKSPKRLKAGDRVRVVRLPPIWLTPGYVVPASTVRVFRWLIARKREVRISNVDEHGSPWHWWRTKTKSGRTGWEGVALDDGCWVRVVPRKCRASKARRK